MEANSVTQGQNGTGNDFLKKIGRREKKQTLALSLWPNKSKIFLSPVHPPRNEENEKEKIGTAVDSAAQWSDSVTLLSQNLYVWEKNARKTHVN